jgi:hypothetical protein
LTKRLLVAAGLLLFLFWGMEASAWAQTPAPGPHRQFLPLAFPAPASCAPAGEARFEALSVNPPPTDRPAAQHPDLNLSLRGYRNGGGALTYIWIDGPADPRAPQLTTLFSPPRRPDIRAVGQVYDWDWAQNRRGPAITAPPVTLLSMDAATGELLRLPDSGYDIGQGYEALALYAEPHRITLKYTREDNVVWGYTLHLENICVDPNLLALYNALHARGRGQLPALRPGQAFARALASPPAIVIRDNGSFMDPRSLKDWLR